MICWRIFLVSFVLASEENINALQQTIDDFTNKANVVVYQNLIALRFNTVKLSQVSVNYLVSGQFLLHNISSADDFSPVIIQYGRIIENELT